MTLLVIEIPRPEGSAFHLGGGVSKEHAFHALWVFLVDQRTSFYAYLLAFFILWVVWRHHHVLFDQLTQVPGAMTGWHFPLLLFVAFLPYAATTVGHYPDN